MAPVSTRRMSAVVGLLAVAALAACGSDTKSATSTNAPTPTTAAATATTPAATATPATSASSEAPATTGATATSAPAATNAAPSKSEVVIGALVDQSGPSAGDRGLLFKALPAWADYINNKGGLNGHPVKFEIRDTASDAAKAQAGLDDLMKLNPIAIYLDSSATESAQAEALGKTGVPIIGTGFSPAVWGAELTSLGLKCDASGKPLPCALPNAFTISTTFGAVLDQAIVEAKNLGAKKIVNVVCAEIDSCSSAHPEFAATGKALGYADVPLVKVSSSAADYTAECVQFIQDGVDYVNMSVQQPVIIQMWKDCQDQGFSGRFGALTSSFSGKTLETPGIRLGGGINAFPWFVDDPLVQEYRDVMKSAGIEEAQLSSTTTAMWSAVQLFAKAQQNLSDSPTGSEALDNMYTIHDEKLGGLIPPITFTKGQPAATRNCFWPMTFEDGKLAAPLGGITYECYPDQG